MAEFWTFYHSNSKIFKWCINSNTEQGDMTGFDMDEKKEKIFDVCKEIMSYWVKMSCIVKEMLPSCHMFD